MTLILTWIESLHQTRGETVLTFTWTTPQPFTTAQRAPLIALARYTAQAITRAQLLAERRTAATTLQLAMLTDLPTIEGVELAARYLPSNTLKQVGGDWYDAFCDRDGDLVLVIGDVTGHDVTAAAAMGQLRAMLRAIAWDADLTPATALTRLDRTLADLHVPGLATIALLRLHLRPDGTAALTWSTAGHPPALLHTPGEGTAVLHATPDLLIGADPDRPRHDHHTDLPAGSLLIAFTDGLVERRRTTVDEGTHALVQQLSGHTDGPLVNTVDHLLRDLAGTNDDDIALLAVRLTD